MFEVPTVFIVGAGASARWDFPVGGALRGEIASQLNVEFTQEGHRVGHITPVVEAFINRVRRDRGKLSGVMSAMRARLFAYDSIDEFIDAQQDDDLTELAKLSIAYVIGHQESEAERAHFHLNGVAAQDFQQRLHSSWLGALATRMASGVRVKTCSDEIGKNVGFVVFNYDRSVEHFLHAWISRLGVGSEKAAEIVNSISIYHPYGKIGDLPWEVGPRRFEFGRVDDLYEASRSIRTFTEQVEDTADLVSMRKLVSDAARVVFLGFGFPKQNMELLAPKRLDARKHVYATVHKVPAGERQRIDQALRAKFECYGNPNMTDDDCDRFAFSYMRLLSS